MKPVSAREADQLQVLALGDMMAALGGPQVALQVLKRGGDAAQFLSIMSERAKAAPAHAGADAALGLTNHDTRGYSISAAINAQVNQDWKAAGLERNLSDVLATRTGIVPNGCFIPLSCMVRDFNAGGATEAANLLGAAVDGSRSVDPLRKASVLAGLGATIVSGLNTTTTVPRFASSSSAGWKSEIGAADVITESTVGVTLTPKRLAVKMEFSRQALVQATPQLDIALSRHLVGALMEQLEYGALNGDGSNDTPVGIRNTAGIGSVVGGLNGAVLAEDHLLDLEYACDSANAPVTANAAFLVNAKTRRLARRTVGSFWSGRPIWQGTDRPLLGYRAGITNNLPSNLDKGTTSGGCSSLIFGSDWSQLLIGLYGGGVDLTVDRITLAPEGKVKIVATLHAGVGVLQPACFAKMDDVITN